MRNIFVAMAVSAITTTSQVAAQNVAYETGESLRELCAGTAQEGFLVGKVKCIGYARGVVDQWQQSRTTPCPQIWNVDLVEEVKKYLDANPKRRGERASILVVEAVSKA